jgi:uncharacterized circularly permuted ATP-grasp superfamily protein
VAILTPGPLNDTYFEHAYIARYLGFMLLEGEDLTGRGRQAHGAHRRGPKPVDVLWRRLDAPSPTRWNWTPVAHRHARPGRALRRGGDHGQCAGVGVLETRAFAGLLPRIARRCGASR